MSAIEKCGTTAPGCGTAGRKSVLRDSPAECGTVGKYGIAGLNNDDTKIVKSRRSGFSRAKLEADMNGLSLCIARDGPESCCWRVLKA